MSVALLRQPRTPAWAIRPFDIVHDIERACELYNRYTNPAKLRTDEAHARCRKAARKVKAYARRRHGSRISEAGDGRLHPS